MRVLLCSFAGGGVGEKGAPGGQGGEPPISRTKQNTHRTQGATPTQHTTTLTIPSTSITMTATINTMNHLLRITTRSGIPSASLSPLVSSQVPSFSHHHQNNNNVVATTTKTSSPPIIRSMATGTRGARGHGWLRKYRAGLGGRHLQGRWHWRDVDELNEINDQVFAMNETLNADDNIPTEAYLDLSVAGDTPRRVVIELASAALPKTTENFRLLCQEKSADSNEEEEGASGGYENTSVYKIEKTVGLCMGDVVSNDGSGGRCHPKIGTSQTPFSFGDEGFLLSHTQPGMVSMMSPGVHRNDSRFLITTTGAAQLDGRFVAFGRVKEGMDVIEDIATSVFTKRGRPTVEIKVAGCGVP